MILNVFLSVVVKATISILISYGIKKLLFRKKIIEIHIQVVITKK